MSGGAPVLCPDPDCEIGMLEDYHPAHERDDVPHDTGYVGHCTEGCGSYYLPDPIPVEKLQRRPDELYVCDNCEADLERKYRHCPACGYPGVSTKDRIEATLEVYG